MEIKNEVYGVWSLFILKGKLNAESAPELNEELAREIEKRMDIVIDMKGLDYISSSGLRSLLMASKKARDLNHRVAICGIHDLVQEVIESSGIDALVDVYDDISKLPFANDFLSVHKAYND